MLGGFGDPADHARAVEQVRAGLPPLFDFVATMPYTEVQKLLDEGTAWGFHCYEKSVEIDTSPIPSSMCSPSACRRRRRR